MWRWTVVLCALATNVEAATFVVNSTADDADQTIGNGVCATAAGECTLRAAVQEANSTPAQDSITFQIITMASPIVIAPSTILPSITAPVLLDARTQSGWLDTPLITLDGGLVTVGGKTGLSVNLGTATGCEISGLKIRGWDNGLSFASVCTLRASHIMENVIGVNPSLGGTLIGGMTATDRNVISRNTFAGIFIQTGIGIRIVGNYIGTSSDGTTADGNGFGILFRGGNDHEVANNLIAGNGGGIQIEDSTSGLYIHDNLIGTTASGNAPLGNRTMIGIQHRSTHTAQNRIERNTISNCSRAIDVWGGRTNVVAGNFLGTTSAGTGSIPNDIGVYIRNGGTSNLIGDLGPTDRNIIVSSQYAILVEASPSNTIHGNWIGRDAAGTPQPNVTGLSLDGADNIVRSNLIANNTGVGLTYGRDVRLYHNSIMSNGALGIDLGGTGPTPNSAGDAIQDFPILANASTDGTRTYVRGTVTAAPSSSVDVELFASPTCDASGYGEGQTPIGPQSIPTNAEGDGSFLIEANAVPAGMVVTATSTGPSTSEFSACITVTNCPAIGIAPTTLPGAITGTAYMQSITANGVSAGFTFTASGLPPGLTLAADGTLSGTPTTTGSFTFTVKATDQNGCNAQRTYTLAVCPPITVSPATIADGLTQTTYNVALSASGGTPAYTFALTSGVLPTGLTLAAGTLAGTPTAGGNFTFTLTATDANACTGSRSYTVHVDACDGVLEPASLPLAVSGVPYDAMLSVTGGVAPFTYTVAEGTLPAGLTLVGDHLTGTPTGTGSVSFTITATDALGCTNRRMYTLMTTCASIAIAPATLDDGLAGESYAETLTASGGQVPYSFAATHLPPGLSLASTGVLSGEPQAGEYTFSATATDANGCIGMIDYTLRIVASPDDNGNGDGCGCASNDGGGASTLLLLALGLAAGRRRRQTP